MLEKAKKTSIYFFSVFFLLIITIFYFVVIKGVVQIGTHLLQSLIDFSWIVFAINLFIFLPITLIRKFRLIGGLGLYFSSYVYGITLWFMGLLIAYSIWGLFSVFLGLIFAGVGVVVVAMFATLFTGQFFILFILLILTALTFGTRVLGMYLASMNEHLLENDQPNIMKKENIEIYPFMIRCDHPNTPKECPFCHSKVVMGIIYGYIPKEKRPITGYMLSGSSIEEDSPAWYCSECKSSWGNIQEENREITEIKL